MINKYDTTTWPLSDKVVKSKVPGRVRVLNLCDPHLCAFDPPSYKIPYYQLQKDTLEQVFNYGLKNEIDYLLWAGDIFNLKSAARNPMWFMTEVDTKFAELQAQGLPSAGICGNHDIKYGNLTKGLEGQPLDQLISIGLYHLLDRQEIVIDAGDFTLRIAGGSYHFAQAAHVKDKTKKGATFLLTLGHFWFGKECGEFFGEPIYGPDLLNGGESDVYVIGHHHEDQGVQKVGNKLYVAHGSITKVGAHQHDLERRPAVSVIEFTAAGPTPKVLRPKYPEPDVQFDLQLRAAAQTERKEMEEFISTLGKAEIETADPSDILAKMPVTTEVRERCEHYLNEAEKAKA